MAEDGRGRGARAWRERGDVLIWRKIDRVSRDGGRRRREVKWRSSGRTGKHTAFFGCSPRRAVGRCWAHASSRPGRRPWLLSALALAGWAGGYCQAADQSSTWQRQQIQGNGVNARVAPQSVVLDAAACNRMSLSVAPSPWRLWSCPSNSRVTPPCVWVGSRARREIKKRAEEDMRTHRD